MKNMKSREGVSQTNTQDTTRLSASSEIPKDQQEHISALIAELEAMIRVWENHWKVDRHIYIANARAVIARARTPHNAASGDPQQSKSWTVAVSGN